MTDRPDSADVRQEVAGAAPCGPTGPRWMDQSWEAMTRLISEEDWDTQRSQQGGSVAAHRHHIERRRMRRYRHDRHCSQSH